MTVSVVCSPKSVVHGYIKMDNGESRTNQSESRKVDTGLVCLVMVAGYHGLAVDPEQLRHTLAWDPRAWGHWISSGQQKNWG